MFTGEKFTCPQGEMVVLDIANGNPFDYTCVDRTLREYTLGPTIIERQDSQTPFLEGTHLGIKRVEARTGFDQSD